MKTYVTNDLQDSRVPFLRGILIRSLQDAGLAFEEAFDLATEVRSGLDNVPEISADQLRSNIDKRLRKRFSEAVVESYRQQTQASPARITVTSLTGKDTPFSRGRHQRYLMSSGLSEEPAEAITDALYDQLLLAAITHISTCQLGYLTWLWLKQETSKKAARRYLVWSEFQRSGRPLLLVISGSVGTGKSTMATELAHRLEIVRVQSTDILREVMRMMLPEQLLPTLHQSSFDAWKAISRPDPDDRDQDALVIEGYHSQAGLLAVPCEAVIQRALKERVPVIIEGVHAHPDLVQVLPDDHDAIMVRVMLAVLSSSELKSRLAGRGDMEPLRGSSNYLDSFDSIWSLQSYLLSEADRCDIPIISNNNREKSHTQVIRTINHEMSKQFKGSPEEVFGEVVQTQGITWRQYLNLISSTDR